MIGGGIIAANLEHLGYEPLSGPTFDLHNDVQGVRNIVFNRRVRNFHATLQDARCKARNASHGRVGVNGG